MFFPSRVGPSGHHTQLGFDVQDIRAVIRHLESTGLAFEDYPMPGFRTEGHLVNIAPYWAAWFKDSEGNSLGIWEPDSAPSGIGMITLTECTSETNLPAHDMRRARKFYEDRLGFQPLEEFADGGVSYEAGGTQFIVSPATVTPSQDHIQIAFEATDLDAETSVLDAIGVEIDDSVTSLSGLPAAMFRDSEGNQLSLIKAAPTAVE